ncbi:MAG: hypothetical protein KBB37_07725 [Bacteroidia bacterium]|jgi:hypothetical protein|nr:hypothetical protein [Bacteroidia bacterium]MBP9180568.1 hypothetical protein [Bacteroidia bacterium]
MKKKLYLTLFLLISGACSFAQDSLVEWDPAGTRFSVQLLPYYIETNGANQVNFGMGAKADYYFPKVLSLHAGVKQALYDLNNYNANGKGFKTSENTTNLFQQFDFGAGLFFNIDGNTKTRVYAWPGTGYIDPVEKDTLYDYTKEKLPCRTMIGLRGGFYQWRQSVDAISASKGPLIAKDGYIFNDSMDLYTNITSSGYYAGISLSKLVDVFYTSADGKHRNASFIRNIYLDVLYAPTITIDNIVLNGISYDISGIGGLSKKNMGGRIVYEKTSTRDFPKLNFSYRVEAGIRPGLADKGFYIMQTIGLGFAR